MNYMAIVTRRDICGRITRNDIRHITNAKNPEDAAQRIWLSDNESTATVELYEIQAEPSDVFDIERSIRVEAVLRR